jgi:hypothetical protein
MNTSVKIFSGFSLFMFEQFANDLLTSVQKRLSLRRTFVDNPCIPLSGLELESMRDYYDLLKKTQRIEDLYIRKEMVRHLTLAFHYESPYCPAVRNSRNSTSFRTGLSN